MKRLGFVSLPLTWAMVGGESGSLSARFRETQWNQRFRDHLAQPQQFSVFRSSQASSSVCRRLLIFLFQ